MLYVPLKAAQCATPLYLSTIAYIQTFIYIYIYMNLWEQTCVCWHVYFLFFLRSSKLLTIFTGDWPLLAVSSAFLLVIIAPVLVRYLFYIKNLHSCNCCWAIYVVIMSSFILRWLKRDSICRRSHSSREATSPYSWYFVAFLLITSQRYRQSYSKENVYVIVMRE